MRGERSLKKISKRQRRGNFKASREESAGGKKRQECRSFSGRGPLLRLRFPNSSELELLARSSQTEGNAG